MIYKEVGHTAVKISILSMGGMNTCPMGGPEVLMKTLNWRFGRVIFLKALVRREEKRCSLSPIKTGSIFLM